MTAFHITNSKGRDATVTASSLHADPAPKLGVPNKKIIFKRYIAATEAGSHTKLLEQFGADYSQHLIEGDPEVDIETIGLTLEQTQTVYTDGSNELMYVDPKFIEVLFSPDGTEKERREPVDTVSNIAQETPVRWTGKFISISDAVRRFAFRRSLQLRHVDGLTYDYLFEIAKDLESKNSLMALGTGEKGSGPLIFQANGKPYRGFLQGKTNGASYILKLHLSEMELKKPAIS